MEKIKFEPLLKEIYRLSKKVSADLPFHATGIEKQLQVNQGGRETERVSATAGIEKKQKYHRHHDTL